MATGNVRPSSFKEEQSVMSYAKELDMFPKILDECTSSSRSGGIVALLTFGFMFALVASELIHFRGFDRSFKYGVDSNKGNTGLIINIDIDINSKCDGMFVLDILFFLLFSLKDIITNGYIQTLVVISVDVLDLNGDMIEETGIVKTPVC